MNPEQINQAILQHYRQISQTSMQKAAETLKNVARGTFNILKETPMVGELYVGIGNMASQHLFGNTQPGNTPPITRIF